MFALTEQGVAEAATFAANRNREGANVYVGVNPRKPATRGSASDTDVAIAYWHFADLDSQDAVDLAGQRMKALAPTLTVTTGTPGSLDEVASTTDLSGVTFILEVIGT